MNQHSAAGSRLHRPRCATLHHMETPRHEPTFVSQEVKDRYRHARTRAELDTLLTEAMYAIVELPRGRFSEDWQAALYRVMWEHVGAHRMATEFIHEPAVKGSAL